MNMAAAQGRPDGDDTQGSKPHGGSEESKAALPSTLTPTAEHAKHWARTYRTGIASGASSVLSTVTAVSSPSEGRAGVLLLTWF
jgi:hypothetical protein